MPEPAPTAARIIPAFLLFLAILVLSGCQDIFLYHPSTDSEETLLARAATEGLDPWPRAGEGRMGWYAPPADTSADAPPVDRSPTAAAEGRGAAGDRHRVIVFHGNGGQSVDRDHFVRGFQSERALGSWEVYLLEYPGFGSRPGEPSEAALVAAASQALGHLLEEDPSRPVYVVGESLGTGVASQIAAANPEAVPAVLLITPFTNVVDVGARTAPRFLVRMVLRDRYDNEQALARYNGRVGVLLAGQDRVVPTDLGRDLYEGYRGPKRLWIQEEAGHNNLDYHPDSPFWEELTSFLTAD
jgi:hypothetical protein